MLLKPFIDSQINGIHNGVLWQPARRRGLQQYKTFTDECVLLTVIVMSSCRVKLEDRLATVTSAREAADSAAAGRELDCERQLDALDAALQVSAHAHDNPVPNIVQCRWQGIG